MVRSRQKMTPTIDYAGPDRRIRPVNDRRHMNCLEHSGLVERVANVEERTEFFEKEDYLTTAAYYWTTSLLVTILLTILSATLYTAYQGTEALREVKISQSVMNQNIDQMQEDLNELKRKVTTQKP